MQATWDDLRARFERWINEAHAHYTNLPEGSALHPRDFGHNAMALATVTPEGLPSVRVVLLKGLDQRGLTFFTNYDSQKGRDLAAHPHAAATFYWPLMARQLRVRGPIEKVPRQESLDYWQSRPFLSQVSGSVSPQGRPVPHANWLRQEADTLIARTPEKRLPCPQNWGGYLLRPQEIEFWENDAFRLHRRELYTRGTGANWEGVLLAP